jgi:hypothetical protein
VELTWDAVEFAGVPATRVQLAAVDRQVLTVDLATASGRVEPDPASRAHPKVRRWDQRDTAATHLVNGAVEVPARSTEWISLEDGIVIEFDRGETGEAFRVGDYWTIPARAATADIDWPRDSNGEPLFQPPQGPLHHYAPLGFLGTGSLVSLQKAFRSLATQLLHVVASSLRSWPRGRLLLADEFPGVVKGCRCIGPGLRVAEPRPGVQIVDYRPTQVVGYASPPTSVRPHLKRPSGNFDGRKRFRCQTRNLQIRTCFSNQTTTGLCGASPR